MELNMENLSILSCKAWFEGEQLECVQKFLDHNRYFMSESETEPNNQLTPRPLTQTPEILANFKGSK